MRGKGGGYRLCKSPDQFTTGQILRLMEGSLAPVACLEAGSSPCDRAGECRTLSLWAGLNDVNIWISTRARICCAKMGIMIM